MKLLMTKIENPNAEKHRGCYMPACGYEFFSSSGQLDMELNMRR